MFLDTAKRKKLQQALNRHWTITIQPLNNLRTDQMLTNKQLTIADQLQLNNWQAFKWNLFKRHTVCKSSLSANQKQDHLIKPFYWLLRTGLQAEQAQTCQAWWNTILILPTGTMPANQPIRSKNSLCSPSIGWEDLFHKSENRHTDRQTDTTSYTTTCKPAFRR